MDRKRKDFTKEELSELHVREEDELARLKRQHRIMTNDRNAVLGAYNIKNSKHSRLLANLRREEAELRLNIEVAKGRSLEDEKDLDRLRALIEEGQRLDKETHAKKRHLADIEYQIRDVKKNIAEMNKKNAPQIRAIEKRTVTGSMELMKVQNRLDTTVKLFCSVIAENKKLREEIESLLKDRKIFNENWEKLIFRLNSGKRTLLDLIEQSTLAYDQREEWMEKLSMLKYKAHNIQTQHINEMRELKRKLDLQTDLGRFLEKKCQKRILVDVERREKQKRDDLRAKMEGKLQEYRGILQQIKDFVGEDDVDKITAQYVKREEENFALFTYVNELNAELEALVDNTEELRARIEEQLAINQERSLKQKHSIETLQKELEECMLDADKAELELNTKTIQLMQTIRGVADLFQLLNCDNAPIIQLLGDNTMVNQHNVLLHMAILETKFLDVLKRCCHRNVDKISFLEPTG